MTEVEDYINERIKSLTEDKEFFREKKTYYAYHLFGTWIKDLERIREILNED